MVGTCEIGQMNDKSDSINLVHGIAEYFVGLSPLVEQASLVDKFG